MTPTTTTSIGGAHAQYIAALPRATAAQHVARQIWGLEIPTSTYSISHCTPFTLPSKGFIAIGDNIITLTTDAIFQPECTGNLSGEVVSIADLRDPFYASTIPQTYVIAASTVIAWILVIMLVITPRTRAFMGGSSGSAGILSSHGIIGGARGGLSSLTGGSRPWLQKIATLGAAISLTIATADTFRAAKHQYDVGYMDAQELRDEVLGSLEIRIVRVISDIFLWLAQVQTLIRLFPRHKEKVLIKWIGFALIVLDTIFSCLNSFMVDGRTRSPRFQDAIPALSYLFELALGLLYSAWVLYYALTKRRYAFYHPKMRNICIIALLSIVAVSTPVVFFITDVSNPAIAGWGDYVRWVGAGAASVVVWEWVERIEAIERDEKKDDILGREVFDGDEMLDVAPTEEAVFSPGRSLGSKFRRKWDDNDSSGAGDNPLSTMEQGQANQAGRFRSSGKARRSPRTGSTGLSANTDLGQDAGAGNVRFRDAPVSKGRNGQDADNMLPPRNSHTPVSRADTTSAASTVYVVRYNDRDIPQPVRRRVDFNRQQRNPRNRAKVTSDSSDRDPEKEVAEVETDRIRGNDQFWHSVSNPFKRKRASPPKEVQQARAAVEAENQSNIPIHNFSRWDVMNRLGVLAAETGERFRDKAAGRRPEVDLPITIVPAQPRGSGRTWSPAILESNAANTTSNPAEISHVTTSSDGSTTLINSQSHNSPSRSSQPNERGPTEAPRTTVPRADQLVPNQSGGAIVVPAPERRSPFDRDSTT